MSERKYYDIFNINLDGSDGKARGSIVFSETWHRPILTDEAREELAAKLGYEANAIRIIRYDFEGYLEVWHIAYGFPTHRVRRTNRTYRAGVAEKSCPQCGMLAVDGSFVRGALMCREHGFLFGGC